MDCMYVVEFCEVYVFSVAEGGGRGEVGVFFGVFAHAVEVGFGYQ